jgi:hypothetical protein
MSRSAFVRELLRSSGPLDEEPTYAEALVLLARSARAGKVQAQAVRVPKATAVRRPEAKRGRDGEDGVSGREVVNAASQPSESAVITAQADCPGTKKVVGGGAIPRTVEGAEFQLSMTAQLDDNTWQATVRRVGGTGPWTVTVQAVCVIALP